MKINKNAIKAMQIGLIVISILLVIMWIGVIFGVTIQAELSEKASDPNVSLEEWSVLYDKAQEKVGPIYAVVALCLIIITILIFIFTGLSVLMHRIRPEENYIANRPSYPPAPQSYYIAEQRMDWLVCELCGNQTYKPDIKKYPQDGSKLSGKYICRKCYENLKNTWM